MARFGVFLAFLFLIFAVGFLAGDRYGAPAWARAIASPAFALAETPLIDPATSPETKTGTAAGSTDNADANRSLRINDAGLRIIKESEGLRLEAYSAGGNSFIGYGHLRGPGDPARITEVEAEALLRADVRTAEDGVRSRLTRTANANEFSAMVSLAYNLGVGGFSRSPVLAKFNAGDGAGAADAFLTHIRADGRELETLRRRREKERALFLTPA